MRTLLAVLALSTLALVPSSSSAAAHNAVYVDGTGATHLADFSWSGGCGPGTITLALDDGGVLTADAYVDSLLGTCAPSRCLDCPPVPAPVEWRFSGPGVRLVAAGVGAYYQYQTTPIAWVVEGSFLGGTLAAYGTI
jgi:hypothetical protein